MRPSELWDVVRMVAPELGIKPEQIRLWRYRRRIPYKLRVPIAEAAKKRKRMLTLQDFEAA